MARQNCEETCAQRSTNSANCSEKRGLRFEKACEKVFAGMSNRAIAQKLGVSEGTVRNYKAGDNINSSVLEKLHTEGVDVQWLLTGKPVSTRIPLSDSPAAHVSQAYAQGAHDHGIITDPTADLTGNSTAAADLRTGLTPAQVAACRTLAEVVSELMAGQKRILEDPAFAERVLGRYATLAKELLPE